MTITVRGLLALKPGKWLSDKGRNQGALRAKGSANGARFYYRYRDSSARYVDLALGIFDANGRDGLTLDAARRRVGELRARYQTGTLDLRETLDAEARAEAARVREAKEREEAEQAQQTASLGALMGAYVANLKRQGKVSWREVENAARLHIHEAWPALWATPAQRITSDDLLTIIASIADAGKLREAGKMRSSLRAAYSAAVKARRQASALPALRDLRLQSNPARELEPLEGGTGGRRERALSLAELHAYWRRIAAMSGADGALLRFHLLTGGQRLKQLGRLTSADFDADARAVKLRDIKGRRTEPRIHVVPLVPAALEALQAMTESALGPYLFSIDGGESGASYFFARDRVCAIASDMAEAGELENGPFTPGDLRRTVETRLSGAGVTKSVRAQLQSHGLSGVQDAHYDMYEYLDEKRAALETLHRLCTGKNAKVIPIKRAAKR